MNKDYRDICWNVQLQLIKTREEARQIAIEFQEWAQGENLSYSELAEYGGLFKILGNKFNLSEEFCENGI